MERRRSGIRFAKREKRNNRSVIDEGIYEDVVCWKFDSDIFNIRPLRFIFQIPTTSVKGHYKLRVEGLYAGIAGGVAFANETDLEFSQRSMTIFIQTNKPIYKQGEQGFIIIAHFEVIFIDMVSNMKFPFSRQQ